MSKKHTAGPWSIGGPTKYVNQVAIDPAIGVLYGAGDELKANARLVVAAPKLLAELKGLVFQIEAFAALHGEADFETGAARAAIALATGEDA